MGNKIENMREIEKLEEEAGELRKIIFKTIYHAGGGHLPSSFSITELLTVLYFKFLNIDPKKPDWENRDRFILSKGHACIALYSVLAKRGFFKKELLFSVCKKGSILGGHPDMLKTPGVDASTGSLGHGFPYGIGVAFSGKLNNKSFKVYSILGDGECQEGSIWEAAIFAAQKKLDNLIAIVDYNKLQAIDFIENVGSLFPFSDKWRAFGWEVREIDGHNIQQIIETFEDVPFKEGKPNLIIAHTTKGKGISFMENVPIWHYRMPNEEEMRLALRDLEITEKELNKI